MYWTTTMASKRKCGIDCAIGVTSSMSKLFEVVETELELVTFMLVRSVYVPQMDRGIAQKNFRLHRFNLFLTTSGLAEG